MYVMGGRLRVGGYTSASVYLGECNLTYAACYLWPFWLHNIFQHYLLNDMIFRKELLNANRVFRFSLQLSFATFLVLQIIQRDIVINVKTSSFKVPFIIVIF
jgi:hypothetical protein